MAAASVESGSAMAHAIQSAVQPKLMENGWVAEENDTTLSEYVTMMLVNGKDLQGVQSELGGELLGVGEDDPTVGEFARWLFEQVNSLAAPQQVQAQAVNAQSQEQKPQPIPTVQDSQMEDVVGPLGDAYVYTLSYAHNLTILEFLFFLAQPQPHIRGLVYQSLTSRLNYIHTNFPLCRPTGPKSMRAGRGRGGRMLGQLNRQMDRAQELPDSLRRIKGAASGNSGRINAHSGRDGAPRGPKSGNVAGGVQRMMNHSGRGGHNNMMQMPGGPINPQQQMQFMQLMEMQANVIAQMVQQNGGQMQNMRGGFKQNSGLRGGKQNGQFKGRQPQQQLQQQQHAVNGRLPDAPLQAGNNDSGMDVDNEDATLNRKDLFDTLCRFNLSCTNPNCGFAHQSPAAPTGTIVDLTDTCTFGVACANHKCSGRHPSPAQKTQHAKLEVDCKFYPNCTNPRCPFRHPTEMPPCRNGADCTVANCKFTHSKIMCRYNPCLNPNCAFKHADGQKRGKFEDKVWTADGGSNGDAGTETGGGGGKSERFADFSIKVDDQEEELILPGRNNGAEDQQQQQQADTNAQMETQTVT